MRKLCLILVIFTLVAGAVFAETNIGGGFGYKAEIMAGSSAKDTKILSSIAGGDASAMFSFSGEKYGGKVKFYATDVNGPGPYWGASPFAFAWWQPISQFKLQLGHNPDGDWGAAAITGWGFHASAQDYVAIDDSSEWGSSFSNGNTTYGQYWKTAIGKGFYGGISAASLLFSVYPVDGLAINIGLPFGVDHDNLKNSQANNYTGPDPATTAGHADYAGKLFTEVLRRFHINIGYDIANIGKVNLSYVMQGGERDVSKDGAVEKKVYASPGDIFVSFNVAALKDMGVGLDVGVGLHLPYDTPNAAGTTVTTNNLDTEIGFGATYSAGDFGAKLRFGVILDGGSTFSGLGTSVDTKAATRLGVSILPYYNLGVLTAFFNAGLGVKTAVVNNGVETKGVTDWYINPYIQVPVEGLNFWAGFKLGSDGIEYGTAPDTKKVINWSIPIGISVGF